MDKKIFENIKKFLVIIFMFLTIGELQAQDFSIEAETLVYNKGTNIFSAKGNVKIYFFSMYPPLHFCCCPTPTVHVKELDIFQLKGLEKGGTPKELENSNFFYPFFKCYFR